MVSLSEGTVAVLDAIGAVLIGSVLTFFATQYFIVKSHRQAEDVAEAGDGASKAREEKDQQEDQLGKSEEPSKAGGARASPKGEFGKFDADETFSLIKTRRSIFPKDFDELSESTVVPRASLERLLEAANWAPCHGKTEPWRFVVLPQAGMEAYGALERSIKAASIGNSDPDKLRMVLAKMQKKAKSRVRCSYMVFICMARVPSKKGKLMPEWEDQAAVACAVQNLHLMATAMGIAGYWSSGGVGSFYDEPKIKDFLGLAESDSCLGTFVVGSSQKATSYRASRGPIADKVTWL